MNIFEPDVTARPRPPGIAQPARRNLLSLFTIALICLSAAGAATADQRAETPAVPVLPSNAYGAVSTAHVALYNEDPDDPKGRRYPGSVLWRIDRIKTAGQQDDVAIHADVEVPELKMKMRMDFKRNADKTMPASHIFELKFAAPEDASGREVISVPGLLMKFGERSQGAPLAGQTVKVSKGFFLVGLSNVGTDREHNLQLLKEREWLDIPIVYANQHRAILAIEKGYGGEEIFNDAMTRWEQPR
jgi:hypothetical protein